MKWGLNGNIICKPTQAAPLVSNYGHTLYEPSRSVVTQTIYTSAKSKGNELYQRVARLQLMPRCPTIPTSSATRTASPSPSRTTTTGQNGRTTWNACLTLSKTEISSQATKLHLLDKLETLPDITSVNDGPRRYQHQSSHGSRKFDPVDKSNQ